MMPNSPHPPPRDNLERQRGAGAAPREPAAALRVGPNELVEPMEIDGQQRQNAMLAERDPGRVASALAVFRKRRGFERSSLAAWLRLSPDRLVALTLEQLPDPNASDYGTAVAVMAERHGADAVRLTEALGG
jgi:hypothetical protein